MVLDDIIRIIRVLKKQNTFFFFNNTHSIIPVALPGHAAQSRTVSMETGHSECAQSGNNPVCSKTFWKLCFISCFLQQVRWEEEMVYYNQAFSRNTHLVDPFSFSLSLNVQLFIPSGRKADYGKAENRFSWNVLFNTFKSLINGKNSNVIRESVLRE